MAQEHRMDTSMLQPCTHVHDGHNGTEDTHSQCGDAEGSHHGPNEHESEEKCCHEGLWVATVALKITQSASLEHFSSTVLATEYLPDAPVIAPEKELSPPPSPGLSIARHILYARFLN